MMVIVHRLHSGIALAALVALATLASGMVPSRADPCGPAAGDAVECGQGNGAWRVIANTTSPSKRLAVAWHNAASAPSKPPGDTDVVEDALVRLSDGVVLAKLAGAFWQTSDVSANHMGEVALWSPDSTLFAEIASGRWSTGTIKLYSLGANDEVGRPVDILKIVEPAARAALARQIRRKDTSKYAFTVGDGSSIDGNGVLHMSVLLEVPKGDEAAAFKVTVKTTRKNKILAARLQSVRPAKTP
jgi:hypothetical protein